ncbi:MAG: tRNA (N(6)-L-threonylcarbamoyladenosine(37)-C(2))-methylthiotransferase MtaB [Bacilli bacterium]
MKFKLFFLGCKVNAYEIDSIRVLLTKKGLIEAKKDENPDVIVINTCSVTSVADKKSRQMIHKYRIEQPKAILCVIGCFTQGISSNIDFPFEADIILGNKNKSALYDKIEEFLKNKERIVDIDHDNRSFTYDNMPSIQFSEKTRAYVKIQDGCDNFCSYCLIPFVRGKSRSREPQYIIEEIKDLIKNGYKEIVFTGIDVASYGKDLKEQISFSDLLEKILEIDENNTIIRISSIEESMIDDKFINLIEKDQRIARHMHLSLQSGSNYILKKMNRKYTTEEYLEKLRRLQIAVPDINITTDVIVGFPGETEENFVETLNFVKTCGFSHIHVFPYSVRKGTAAAVFPNQIDTNIKKDRVKRLITLGDELKETYINKFIGQEMEVLIECCISDNIYTGHTSNFLEVMVNSPTDIIGKVVKTTINFDNVK